MTDPGPEVPTWGANVALAEAGRTRSRARSWNQTNSDWKQDGKRLTVTGGGGCSWGRGRFAVSDKC